MERERGMERGTEQGREMGMGRGRGRGTGVGGWGQAEALGALLLALGQCHFVRLVQHHHLHVNINKTVT
jgi:hypothetical protein